jgi:flagellar biosynthetic protein FlhB
MAGERTEQATQHRREKARREGDILHSRELTAAAGTLAGVIVLEMLSGRMIEAWREAFEGLLLLGAPERWEPATLAPTLVAMRRSMLAVLGPPAVVMAAVVVAALGAGIAQTGGVTVHGNAIAFKPERINPIANLKNCFLCARLRGWESR